MAPTLDLSKTLLQPHGDLVLRSPGMNLRRTGPHLYGEKTPVPAKSSRFILDHFLATPLPSPGLPALLPRHGKRPPSRTRTGVVRGISWLCCLLALTYLLRYIRPRANLAKPAVWDTDMKDKFEMVGDAELPWFPSPVVLTDNRGRPRWTVSMPPQLQYPLPPATYAGICQQVPEVVRHVDKLRTRLLPTGGRRGGFYDRDPTFLDVHDADEQGLLFSLRQAERSDRLGHSRLHDHSGSGADASKSCSSTLTVVLESDDAGLGQTLMMLWLAYGLARKDGRDFFIDDTRWAYGRYEQFFRPISRPRCRGPPAHHVIPFPHSAQHLLVSVATIPYIFGRDFQQHFSRRDIFDLAHTGYQALFHLAGPDGSYVEGRTQELTALTRHHTTPSHAPRIGVHVRHGDQHPSEPQYSGTWIPLSTYLTSAERLVNDTSASRPVRSRALIVTASDDPDVYSSIDLTSTLYTTMRAQERIMLASNSDKVASRDPPLGPGEARRFVEESIGWEGGFFSGMFWSLGSPSMRSSVATRSTPAHAAQASMSPDKQRQQQASRSEVVATPEALRLRELVGRTYLLDLAVLGRSDAVVCTASSMGCRLLAVMLGWEKAMGSGKAWVNVDEGEEWSAFNWFER